jgi:hypothetical protein
MGVCNHTCCYLKSSWHLVQLHLHNYQRSTEHVLYMHNAHSHECCRSLLNRVWDALAPAQGNQEPSAPHHTATSFETVLAFNRMVLAAAANHIPSPHAPLDHLLRLQSLAAKLLVPYLKQDLQRLETAARGAAAGGGYAYAFRSNVLGGAKLQRDLLACLPAVAGMTSAAGRLHRLALSAHRPDTPPLTRRHFIPLIESAGGPVDRVMSVDPMAARTLPASFAGELDAEAFALLALATELLHLVLPRLQRGAATGAPSLPPTAFEVWPGLACPPSQAPNDGGDYGVLHVLRPLPLQARHCFAVGGGNDGRRVAWEYESTPGVPLLRPVTCLAAACLASPPRLGSDAAALLTTGLARNEAGLLRLEPGELRLVLQAAMAMRRKQRSRIAAAYSGPSSISSSSSPNGLILADTPAMRVSWGRLGNGCCTMHTRCCLLLHHASASTTGIHGTCVVCMS